VAAYNKFNVFVENLTGKVLDLFGTNPGTDCDVLKLMLVNSPGPVSTNSVKADLTEIAAGNGYTAGGQALQGYSGVRFGGTFEMSANQVVWTASGGTIGPFRYPVLYDDTPTSPADPLQSWWDYGSSITLNAGETFTVKFNGVATGGTIFTLS
jgi:hypothetical protein